VRQGWDVYNSDAVERGRAGWAMFPEIFKTEPLFLPKGDPYERFRIGGGAGTWNADPAKRKLLPGNQFPVEGYDNFMRQVVPRWTSTDEATIAAYTALVDKVCPCVILFHSQAGQFGFKVAQARPDKVKALVALEPAGAGDPKQAGRLKAIPTLFVYGDYIAQDARWPQIRKNGVAFGEAIAQAGGAVDVVDLPQAGIRGNSHLVMMDRNNLEVAALIQLWLEKQGLYR
jgi:pimeloyl-ACP methyl ester carboxylesterase